jgi:hypothetical protein
MIHSLSYGTMMVNPEVELFRNTVFTFAVVIFYVGAGYFVRKSDISNAFKISLLLVLAAGALSSLSKGLFQLGLSVDSGLCHHKHAHIIALTKWPCPCFDFSRGEEVKKTLGNCN